MYILNFTQPWMGAVMKYINILLAIISIILSYVFLLGSQQFFIDYFYEIISGNKSNDGPILVFLGYLVCLPLTMITYFIINKFQRGPSYLNVVSSLTGLIVMIVIAYLSAKIAVIP